MKKNTLQFKIISRIDNFCGVEKLNQKLEMHKIGLPVREKMMFANMIMYNQNLYINSVKCEEDFIVYKNASLKHLDLLEKYIKITNCEYLSLVKGNIQLGISSAKDVRILA